MVKKDFEKGLEYYKKFQYMKAIDSFDNELTVNSKNGYAWYYKGKCLEKICEILNDDQNKISNLIKKFEENLENIQHEKSSYLNINPKNKNQTYGSYKYYQTTTSQLYWGYSKRKTAENYQENEMAKIQEQLSKLKKEKAQIIHIREKYLEDAKQCQLKANKLGLF